MTRITPAEAVLLMPQTSLHGAPRNAEAERIDAIIAEARQARDAAIAVRIKGFFHALREVLTTIRNRRETIEQLRGLTDRELSDIGLTRSGIPAAAVAAAPLPANDTVETSRAA